MDQNINIIFEDTIFYFKELSKHYRNSTELNLCCNWLRDTINKLGFTPSVDNFSDNSTMAKEKYGNIMFDVPANDENLDSIILQAHYDMVVVTDDLEYTKKNGIEAIEEIQANCRTIHSKNFKTTLGADDGIGVAIILSLAKHQKEFKHGNIRCIITADEEIIDGGSRFSGIKNWIIYDRMINLDNSHLEIVRSGCFSAIETKFENYFETERVSNEKQIYRITIDGLIGGHSANITNLQANSIRVLFEFIKHIEDINIISFNNLNNTKSNAIPIASEMVIGTKLTTQELNNLWEKCKFNNRYPEDPNLKVTIFDLIEPKEHGLTETNSKKIINFIVSLFSGVVKFDENNFPLITGNIGVIENFKCSTMTTKINITTFVRTKENNDTIEINKKHEELAKEAGLKILVNHIDPAWHNKKNSKMQEMIRVAAAKENIPIIIQTTPAWLEPADFAKVRPEMDIISIGCKSEGCHTKQETLYVNTVEPLVSEILSILELNKKEGN